jgi:hypothetical protein
MLIARRVWGLDSDFAAPPAASRMGKQSNRLLVQLGQTKHPKARLFQFEKHHHHVEVSGGGHFQYENRRRLMIYKSS